jgi:hypothetical protein
MFSKSDRLTHIYGIYNGSTECTGNTYDCTLVTISHAMSVIAHLLAQSYRLNVLESSRSPPSLLAQESYPSREVLSIEDLAVVQSLIKTTAAIRYPFPRSER